MGTSRNVGEKNPKARLSNKKVLEIRRRYAAGESGNSLAREYGVANTAVHAAIKRLAWKHI